MTTTFDFVPVLTVGFDAYRIIDGKAVDSISGNDVSDLSDFLTKYKTDFVHVYCQRGFNLSSLEVRE